MERMNADTRDYLLRKLDCLKNEVRKDLIDLSYMNSKIADIKRELKLLVSENKMEVNN